MLVSLAIIGIMSGVVIARYNSFDSTVLLKSAAYDIAATLREAQVYSVSVLGTSGGFNTPFGVTFTPDTQEYQFFRFMDAMNFPYYQSGMIQNINDPAQMSRSITIVNLCVNIRVGGVLQTKCHSDNTSTLTRLDISFRRPEFKALFHVEDPPGSVNNPTNNSDGNIESVQIDLGSLAYPGNVYSVIVGLLGHISVEKTAP